MGTPVHECGLCECVQHMGVQMGALRARAAGMAI